MILVYANLLHPTVHEFFSVDNGTGLTTVIGRGIYSLPGAIERCGVDELRLLTAGPRPASPHRLWTTIAVPFLFEHIRESGATVLIDAPAVLSIPDALHLAVANDALLVIGRGIVRPPGFDLVCWCSGSRALGHWGGCSMEPTPTDETDSTGWERVILVMESRARQG